MKIIKLQSCDGELFEVDNEVVTMCATVTNMLRGKSAFRNSLGGQFSIDGSYVILKKEGRVLASLTKNSDDEAIVSLPDVKAATLSKVIDYCKFHNCPTTTEREKKIWDTDFVQVKQSVLCELASASYYLDIKPLVNLTSRAIATQISGKTSEEIRETFSNINYEVYAPVFASSLAIRARLQRKYNKKKQDEPDQKLLMSSENNDERSVDELLQFIGDEPNTSSSSPNSNTNTNLSGTNSKPTTKAAKKKAKKTKKKKQKNKLNPNVSSNDITQNQNSIELNSSSNMISNSNMRDVDDEDEDGVIIIEDDSKSEEGQSSVQSEENKEEDDKGSLFEEGNEGEDIMSSPEFIGSDDEEDDDLDPEMRAALDKEVEEFRQKLESINSQNRTAPKIQLTVSGSSLKTSTVGVH